MKSPERRENKKFVYIAALLALLGAEPNRTEKLLTDSPETPIGIANGNTNKIELIEIYERLQTPEGQLILRKLISPTSDSIDNDAPASVVQAEKVPHQEELQIITANMLAKLTTKYPSDWKVSTWLNDTALHIEFPVSKNYFSLQPKIDGVVEATLTIYSPEGGSTGKILNVSEKDFWYFMDNIRDAFESFSNKRSIANQDGLDSQTYKTYVFQFGQSIALVYGDFTNEEFSPYYRKD